MSFRTITPGNWLVDSGEALVTSHFLYRFIMIERDARLTNIWLHCSISKFHCCFTLLLVFSTRCVSHHTSVQTWRTCWGTCYRYKANISIMVTFTLWFDPNLIWPKCDSNVLVSSSGGSHKTLREPQEWGQRHQGAQVVCNHWLDCHLPEKGKCVCICMFVSTMQMCSVSHSTAVYL